MFVLLLCYARICKGLEQRLVALSICIADYNTDLHYLSHYWLTSLINYRYTLPIIIVHNLIYYRVTSPITILIKSVIYITAHIKKYITWRITLLVYIIDCIPFYITDLNNWLHCWINYLLHYCLNHLLHHWFHHLLHH